MAIVERTSFLPVPQDRVWAVLAGFAWISLWVPEIDHSCLLTEGDPDIGTLRRIQMGRTTLVETVETWEPNFTLSYAIGGLPSLIRSVTNTWRLEPGDEGTNVTIISDVDAGPHLPQKVIARLFGRRFGSTSDEMLAGLAARVTAAGQRQ